ncbi:MAG: hypothetical protein GQ570_13410 [Helicobacteraceae bacterium]|nr:hypothetical protein [Helicobacteraceae bacterium]
MSKKQKTTIKQANWKSKGMFGKKKEYHNIITTIYYQGDDSFIDTDSKLLFEMICEHFFYKYKKVTLKIKLKHTFGAMFPQAYRLYVYNLIYKKLTNKKIKDDIFKIKDNKELFYRVMLDSQMEPHQKRVLKIITILNIDFKKESDRLHSVLFNKKKKKDFYVSDYVYNISKK